jgi:hypothetical protein
MSSETPLSHIDSRQKFIIATGASQAFEYTGKLDWLIPYREDILIPSPLKFGEFYRDLGTAVTAFNDTTGADAVKLVLGEKVSGIPGGSILKWIVVWTADPAGLKIARVG